MNIEEYLLNKFIAEFDYPTFLEYPDGLTAPFIVIDVTGVKPLGPSVYQAVVAFQSYAQSKYETSELNRAVIETAKELIKNDEIGAADLDTYTPYPDVLRKKYRYQAVFNIVYYDYL